MRTRLNSTWRAALVAAAQVCHSSAGTLYVSPESPEPSPPFANWATAAHVIQDAVDAAQGGDEILVTNGVYTSGGRAVDGMMTNRVAVTKPLTLRSVNGPEVTIIEGGKAPGGGNGDGAVRCVYLTDGAILSGFTLTHGATRAEGTWPSERVGGGVWCTSTNAMLTNCVLTSNSAGAAWGGRLDCCVLRANAGAGACHAALYNSSMTANSGSGARESTLHNCILNGNSAEYGGGASNSTLYNCTVTGNRAPESGGGAFDCVLHHCTVTGNSADSGGGVSGGTLYNCIVWFNHAPHGANYSDSLLLFRPSPRLVSCCTDPLPPGPGNIATDPHLASLTHLAVTSPCIGAGDGAYASGLDIDGEPWARPPAIGADQPRAAGGQLTVRMEAEFSQVATGYPVSFLARSTGPILRSVWDFGDGTLQTNLPVVRHAWTAPGVYSVRLTGYSQDHPDGVTTNLSVTVSEAVAYVDAASHNPVAPYARWETAATNIQEAIAAATLTGRLVLVNDGVYRAGQVETHGTSRVALTNRVVVRSVNGPEVTIIEGDANGVRCALVGDGSVLSGFTVRKGYAVDFRRNFLGGGVLCESFGVVTNCVLTGNFGLYGGGVCQGMLYNCTLTENVGLEGGGANSSMLENCALAHNSADSSGGGAAGSTLDHCTLTGNTNSGAAGSTLYYCGLSDNAAGRGGGANQSTLYYCTLTGNSAESGGGAAGCRLYHCLITGNSAFYGGGGVGPFAGFAQSDVYNCTISGNSAGSFGGGVYSDAAERLHLYNCIVHSNQAPEDPNYHLATFEYSCTTPLPEGPRNIAVDPRFVDAPAGDFRLRSDSPCINSGHDADAPGSSDLDDLPRIVSGTVDMGAYEYQGTGSVISYAWLQRYGLSTDGSADYTDPDADGRSTWEEWRCLTDPTNAVSVLRLSSAIPVNSDVYVSWENVQGVGYLLERSVELGAMPRFTPLARDLQGPNGTITFHDAGAASLPSAVYRLGVEPPQ